MTEVKHIDIDAEITKKMAARKLKCFVIGPDTVIAYDVKDAGKVLEEHTGFPPEDFDEVLGEYREMRLREVIHMGDPDGSFIDDLAEELACQVCEMDRPTLFAAFQEVTPQDTLLTLSSTVEHWIEKNGRGFLCSTEY